MNRPLPGAWKPFRWNEGDDLMSRLRGPGPLVTVELRPPARDLAYASGVDAWIDLHHSISRLARSEVFIFLTDDAVGAREEENLTKFQEVATAAKEGCPVSRALSAVDISLEATLRT